MLERELRGKKRGHAAIVCHPNTQRAKRGARCDSVSPLRLTPKNRGARCDSVSFSRAIAAIVMAPEEFTELDLYATQVPRWCLCCIQHTFRTLFFQRRVPQCDSIRQSQVQGLGFGPRAF